ncbi:SDR family NAD(P)-dependent oxidoreductase, partial [Mycobacterium tuberculosis]|nr:SDR family NAD(P)-dependent oxidoreductase [Mycobacterium tuberculosis]
GKVALVTGSTSGIGLGIARALAEAGAQVMLNGFGDKEEIERTRARIAVECDVKVGFNGADLMQPGGAAELVAATEKLFGRLDILVN